MLRKCKFLVPMFLVALFISAIAVKAEAKKGVTLEGVVNINEAGVDELMLLPGIGQSKAEAIIALRGTAKFGTVEDLVKVKGIGEKLMDNIRAYVTTDGPTTAKLVKNLSIGVETPADGEKS